MASGAWVGSIVYTVQASRSSCSEVWVLISRIPSSKPEVVIFHSYRLGSIGFTNVTCLGVSHRRWYFRV